MRHRWRLYQFLCMRPCGAEPEAMQGAPTCKTMSSPRRGQSNSVPATRYCGSRERQRHMPSARSKALAEAIIGDAEAGARGIN